MDNEKLFDEKLKKRIKDENVIVPPELNEKINGTLHNLKVKKKSYKIHMMIISAAVCILSGSILSLYRYTSHHQTLFSCPRYI